MKDNKDIKDIMRQYGLSESIKKAALFEKQPVKKMKSRLLLQISILFFCACL